MNLFHDLFSLFIASKLSEEQKHMISVYFEASIVKLKVPGKLAIEDLKSHVDALSEVPWRKIKDFLNARVQKVRKQKIV